jgi:thymidylate synthase (FAD)
LEIVRKWVPVAAEAFEDFTKGSVTLSSSALRVLNRQLSGEHVSQAESGLSKGEWAELMEALGREP